MNVLEGCVLWGARVVVPTPGREQVTQELCKIHPGIARMKSLARSCLWCPSMDADMEATCSADLYQVSVKLTPQNDFIDLSEGEM